MKKKLLSLVLAGAMVASTSVSAFAAEVGQDYTIQPNSSTNAEVEIRGNLEADDGSVLPSAITVTVPTATSFTVKKDGTLEAGKMTIVNKGDTKVSVIASEFRDPTSTESINLVKENEVNTGDREKVFLKLTGGDKDVILVSANGGEMYKGSNPEEKVGNDFIIKKMEARSELVLNLTGKGSPTDSSDTTPLSDNFRLVLKIKQEKQ